MLVWLNGPFGGGKTQTAHELARRLPGSVICDPEDVGFGLHRMMPAELRGDFQDLAAWRLGVVEVLELVLAQHDGPVIVPMTIVCPRYFDETVGALRDRGHDVRHFALVARRETVLRRLRERVVGRTVGVIIGRDDGGRRESFAVSKLDLCLDQLVRPQFAEQIWTDEITIAEVADRIAASAGLSLTPNTDGAWRGRVRRAWVGARHIRWR
jgi:hypothetical protein